MVHVSWVMWTTFIFTLLFSWLLISVFHCSPGIAWTIVHLAHFHGNRLTWWEQKIDKWQAAHTKSQVSRRLTRCLYALLLIRSFLSLEDGNKQHTRNRKFLKVVPVVI